MLVVVVHDFTKNDVPVHLIVHVIANPKHNKIVMRLQPRCIKSKRHSTTVEPNNRSNRRGKVIRGGIKRVWIEQPVKHVKHNDVHQVKPHVRVFINKPDAHVFVLPLCTDKSEVLIEEDSDHFAHHTKLEDLLVPVHVAPVVGDHPRVLDRDWR